MKHFRVLSGPSCSAKGPLRRQALLYLERHHPALRVAELVLCVSRFPRLKKGTSSYEVHGVDYYFLPRGLFSQLDPDHFIVGNVRQHIQAIDMDQVGFLLQNNDLIIAEVFHTLGNGLMQWAQTWLGKENSPDFSVKSAFLMPYSEEEIANLTQSTGVTPQKLLEEKVWYRLTQRGEDSPAEIEDRVSTVWDEVQSSANYSQIIVNHAGEDRRSEWGDPLSQEASRVLLEFIDFLLEP